jgi:nucleotide-binding universal stress UspA family protein
MVGLDYFEDARVLVTVDLSQPGWDNLEPVDLLSSVDVVLLGLYQITDQVSPEQARDSFEDEAQERLARLVDRFRHAGVLVDSKLVFSVDFAETIDQVADEENCNAILTWNEKKSFERVGVFLHYQKDWDNIMDSVAALMFDEDREVELVTFYESDNEERDFDKLKTILDVERDYLVDRGLDPEQVSIRIEVTEDPEESVLETADEYDAVVMGETEPSMASKIFGTFHEKVQNNSRGPLLIVRYPHDD